MPLRLNIWSGPRNVSTALMYAFAQRTDTRVVDEPFYGHYLRVSGAAHPGAQDVVSAMNCDADEVIENVILGDYDRPIVMFKQMAHHLIELDHGFLDRTVNALLTRDPREMLPSLAAQLATPTLRDTGLDVQCSLLDELEDLGQTPAVLDSRELLQDPLGVLSRFCHHIGIPFEASMLSWCAGPRLEDGVWARHWYANVHRSTGFQPYRPKTEPFPPELLPLLDICRPLYDRSRTPRNQSRAPGA